ncbi:MULTISPECIES: hypothetical protein [Robertmurraya]|uniref:Uncharacterized protein n=1 Tax=Robertmurraya beringensis TaxID=641660 RepID=A0ABV6KXH5_9BACI
MKTNVEKLPIAIIGTGPVGLAAAAHLISKGELTLLVQVYSNGDMLRCFPHGNITLIR